ncbi:MAG TPA: right-handed parallel beta-helix repeat-containing protein, partial [Vicinamibacterales bacterium]|nr:right-handed parallel beta-helix repeat-containing protein [Vicinamibacterales bacterium]
MRVVCLAAVGFGVVASEARLTTAAIVPQGTVTTCDAANPFDHEPDEVALQACLDNFEWVLLKPDYLPGYVGYIVNDTVKLKHDHILLTTAESPHMATILAGPKLGAPMLRASTSNNYEISFIRFDGNRENRDVRDHPCDDARQFGNVQLTGSGFHIRYVESIGAVCGSAMAVGGANTFEIVSSIFADNGRQPEDAHGISGLWADGLTVFGCRDSTIRDNALWDNTDVDLGVNGGPRCSVYRNTITHGGKYAFAGLVAGDPSTSGGEFSDNIVSSGYNLLGFGIAVGCHPWGA